VAVNDELHGRSRGTRFLSLFLHSLTLVSLALAILALALYFLSYAKAKAFFDWYVAMLGVPQQAGTYLTEESHDRIFGHLPIAASVFGACGVILAVFQRRLALFLADIPSDWKAIRYRLRGQFHGTTEIAVEGGAIFIVFIVGIVLRAWHLGRAVRYDEAWTYVDFASRPLALGLSNYRAPNNHLLNTLLVHFSTQVFGNKLFGLRFPALAAGCLVILASWFVARALYGQLAGILTAGCVAALPAFIEFSVNARGYALQWLFILVVMWFAILLREDPSLRLAWLGFVIAAVAGMYSISTTLIAIAGVFAWMLVSTLVDGEAAKLKSILGKVALTALAIGLLSILLYLPPLLVRGPGAVMAKDIVTWQRHSSFLEGLEFTGQCAWLRWTEGVPAAALWILSVALVIGVLFHRRVCKHRVSMTIAFWLLAAIFAWGVQVFAFPRVWSYLLLSAVMTASAGLSLALTSLAGASRIRQIMLASMVSVTLAVFVGGAVIEQRVLFTSNETGTIIDAGQIVVFLSTELRPGDSLVSNAIINYELLRRSPKLYRSLAKTEEANRVLAVVAKKTGSTELCRPEQIVALLAAQPAADPTTLAQQLDLSAFAPPQVQANFLTSTVYSFERRAEANGATQPRDLIQ
jgi:Dolichyl-phosphate-mannose-protein mannosyltransferase